MTLPTDIDSSYADTSSDASVKLHQQHHDTIHAAVNGLSATFVPKARQPGVVGDRGAAYIRGFSDGATNGGTSRVRHVAAANASAVRLVFGNYAGNSAAPTDGPNAITVKASVEDWAGNCWPVTFNGKRSVSIDGGAVVISDPCPAPLTRGQAFHTRTYVTVATGEVYPLGMTTGTGLDDGGHNYSGGGGSDLTLGGAVPGAFAFVYSPAAIIGTPTNTKQVTVVGLGDSIDDGQGDTPSDTGWLFRALSDNFGYVRISQPGELAVDFIGIGSSQHRLKIAQYGNYAVVGYGRNDLANSETAATIEGYLAIIYTRLVALGLTVYARTMTPETTSTDAWATPGNQTVKSWEAQRVALNTWLRGLPTNVSGVVDAGDACETARNSGIWHNSYTDDGIHPNGTGHAAIAAAVPTASFV